MFEMIFTLFCNQSVSEVPLGTRTGYIYPAGFFQAGTDILKPIANVFTAAADANGLQNSFPCLFFFLHHYKVTQQITKVTMSFKCELWGPFLHTASTPPALRL